MHLQAHERFVHRVHTTMHGDLGERARTDAFHDRVRRPLDKRGITYEVRYA